ncbi:hypothetical protein [Mycolicibacterium psychrotolerans]|uniref:hypothetical protein n=1 Tax=Mycolicibacterium psychrotolerans TaxID=216929 RepID=UPI0018D77E66|nr:hypothetical protein [Mycolicibacterium psychrotolerans]
MARRPLRAILLSVAMFLTPAIASAPVIAVGHAQPSNAADQAAAVTLAWRTLGVNDSLYLGPDSPTSVTVPGPAGLTASRLQGTIQAPTNVDSGFLEITDANGTLLTSIPLPPAATAPPQTPLDVDISAAPARSSSVTLTFTLRATDNRDGFCGPLQQLALSGLSTIFTGVEAPANTVATFFPPVLERVSIYTPTDAGTAEQQSVLSLVSTLTRLYNSQPLAVDVVTQPRGATPPPAGQFARTVVVEAGGRAGLTVEAPGSPDARLRVSGNGDELTTQVGLLVNQLQTLVQTPSARIDQAGATPTLSGDTFTFDQLKMAGKTDVLRTGTVTVRVDRSALGIGRVDAVSVHLLADYTPVPTDDAASIVIRSNDRVLYRAALNDSGRLDATFNVQGKALTQYLGLDMALTYTPHQTCGPLIAPITFQVDPTSTLTLRRGGTPTGGFSSLPSEFSPSFMVAMDGSSPGQLVYAARIINAIARLTSQQLTPQVVDVRTAADSRSGALIVARSAAIADTTLDPPVGGDAATVDIGLPTELRADIADGLGSVQAFADSARGRTVVLITTTDDWRLVDPLLDYIDRQQGGWSALSGDVLAAGAAGVPTNVSVRAGDVQAAAEAPAAVAQKSWVPLAVAAAAILAVVLVAAVLLSRRRATAAKK